MVGLKSVQVEDFLRGNGKRRVVLRFDKRDLVEVECHCDYGALGDEGKRRVKIPRKIEIFEDGKWKPYPVASWIDQDENPDGIFSRVMVQKGNDFYIMQSALGIPDSTLLVAAEEAGIYTETINI